MKNLIEKLTPEQEARIPVYYKKWIDQGFSTDPLNFPKCVELLTFFYNTYGTGAKDVEFVQADNYQEAKKIIEDKGHTFSYNNKFTPAYWWSGYACFYQFLIEELKLPFDKMDLFNNLVEICKEVPEFFTYDDLCVIIDRPAFIKNDMVREINGFKLRVLHNDSGPAVVSRKGKKLYCLGGVVVKAAYVTTPADQLSMKDVLSEENVDVRRELLRRVGLKRFMLETKAQVLHEDTLDMGTCTTTYKLLELDLGEFGKARVLHMINPSTKEDLVEGVEDDCDTVQEALTWRNGFDHKKVETINRSLS